MQSCPIGQHDSLLLHVIDLANVHPDLPFFDQIEQWRLIIQNTEATPDPESRMPRFELLQLRVRIITVQTNDIRGEDLPKSVDDPASKPRTVEEPADPAETVFRTPWARCHPSHPADKKELIESLLERRYECGRNPYWTVSVVSDHEVDCRTSLDLCVCNIKCRLGATHDN